MADSEKGQLYSFQTGERYEHEYGTAYAESMATYEVRILGLLGLNERILPIAEQHIRDLGLRFHVGQHAPQQSYLDVSPTPPAEQGETPQTEEWGRFMVVTIPDLRRRTQWLQGLPGVGEQLKNDAAAHAKVSATALDWVFHDLSLQAVGNAVFMQHEYGRYIKDFNGQRHFDAHLEITNETTLPARRHTFDRLQKGYGLMMLHDTLVRNGIVENFLASRQAILAVKRNPEFTMAMRIDELKRHMSQVPASPERNPIGEFVMRTYDPMLED